MKKQIIHDIIFEFENFDYSFERKWLTQIACALLSVPSTDSPFDNVKAIIGKFPDLERIRLRDLRDSESGVGGYVITKLTYKDPNRELKPWEKVFNRQMQ